MVQTDITRKQHDRESLRYTSDCIDDKWALITPFMPPPRSERAQEKQSCVTCEMPFTI